MMIFVACALFVTLVMNYIPEGKPAFIKRWPGGGQGVAWWVIVLILVLALNSIGVIIWLMACGNWLRVLK